MTRRVLVYSGASKDPRRDEFRQMGPDGRREEFKLPEGVDGIYDLSEQMGVSPWYWWADVPVTLRPSLFVLPGRRVVGERVHTFDEGRERYLFTRGEIARSYPPLLERGGWLWLVAVELSREATVIFEVRAVARWPVEAVTITPLSAP